MSIYKKGRPSRSGYDDISGMPDAPGEYRIRDKEGTVAYVGETNDLKRRVREHKKTGKFMENESVDYMIADGRSTSRTRREHEQQSIEKHSPYRNKSVGGEGRVAGRKNKRPDEYYFDESVNQGSGVGRFFKKLMLGILQLLFVLLMLTAVVFIWYYGYSKQLIIIPLGLLGVFILMKKLLF